MDVDGTCAGLARALRTAGRLLLPSPCAVCGEPDGPMCVACLAAVDDTPRVLALGGLLVHSAWRYDERCAPALSGFKDEGRTELGRPLGTALARVLHAAAQDLGPVAAVPVPTSRRAFRRRGYHVVEVLLRHARAEPVRLLRAPSRVLDQRALSRTAREQNMAGAFRARRWRDARVTRAVLVDDVVTTGATLRAAAAALETAGVHVLAAVTLAWTPQGGSGRGRP